MKRRLKNFYERRERAKDLHHLQLSYKGNDISKYIVTRKSPPQKKKIRVCYHYFFLRSWCPGGRTKGTNLIPEKIQPVIAPPALNRSRSFSGTTGATVSYSSSNSTMAIAWRNAILRCLTRGSFPLVVHQ